MPPTMNILPIRPAGSEKISILLVTSHVEDLASLRNILSHRDWNIRHCSSIAEASSQLGSERTCVVLADSNLPDGTWKDLLRLSESVQQPPMVLVTAKHADDRLWGEVLNLGGYDVLLKPFNRSEVARVVGMAWRCWASAVQRHSTPTATTVPSFA